MSEQEQQCIFCQIAQEKIPSKKVYENDYFIGILDINPAVAGHVLLLAKEHVAIMPQMNEEQVNALGAAAKQLSKLMIQGLQVEGTSIFVANGVAAGQRAPHFMLHVIPREKEDGINLQLDQVQLDNSVMEETAGKLQVAVARQFGVEVKEESEENEEKGELGEESVEEPNPKNEKEEQNQDEQEDGKPNLDALADLLTGK